MPILASMLPAAVYSLLLLPLTLAQTLQLTDTRREIRYSKSEYLNMNFDPSFYNALVLTKQASELTINILVLDTMKQQSYPVSIEGQYLYSGLMNNGNLLVLTSNELRLVNRNDGYSTVKLVQPSLFLQGKTPIAFGHCNDFNQTALFAFDVNRLAEVDLRQPSLASAVEISLAGLSPGYKIVDVAYLSFGAHFAVLVQQGAIESIMIFDARNKQRVNWLNSEDVDDVTQITFIPHLNYLMTLKGTLKLIQFFDCGNHFKKVGAINFSTQGIDPSQIKSIFSPFGTSVAFVISNTKCYFYDIVSMTFLGSFDLPASAQDIRYAEGTPYFLTRQESGSDQLIKIFKFESTLPQFCHKSCAGRCTEPFKPCYAVGSIFLAVLIGMAIVGVVIVVFQYVMVYITQKNSDGEGEIEDEMGNTYELGPSGLVPKRNTLSLPEDFKI